MELKQQISDYVRFLKQHPDVKESGYRIEDANRNNAIVERLVEMNQQLDKGYKAADELIKVLKCVFK